MQAGNLSEQERKARREEYLREYRKKNSAKAVARAKAWAAANPERVKENRLKRREKQREYYSEYYKNNSDDRKAYSAKWTAENRERKREADSKWRAENKERAAMNNKAWREKNGDRKKLYELNRRARKRESPGKISHGLIERLFMLQRGKCPCCGEPLGDDYHVDHIIPLALGGAHADSNIQLLRAVCNMRKGAKHPVEFMRRRGFLI